MQAGEGAVGVFAREVEEVDAGEDGQEAAEQRDGVDGVGGVEAAEEDEGGEEREGCEGYVVEGVDAGVSMCVLAGVGSEMGGWVRLWGECTCSC